MSDDVVGLTGNPFVDSGLGVLASMRGLSDPSRLTRDDIRAVHGDGRETARRNSRLKAFTQVFGTNGPLYQGKKKGKEPPAGNIVEYSETLNGFLHAMSAVAEGRMRCQSCGKRTTFDFSRCRNRAKNARALIEHEKLEGVAEQPDFEEHVPGRDWFPLAGSLGSDAQALPAASVPARFCPACLLAVHYLPTAALSLKGRLAVFQCADVAFWYELIRTMTEEAKSRIAVENYETPGSGEGAAAIVRRLVGLGRALRTGQRGGAVPKNASLQVWLFSNAGASANCEILDLPHRAVMFFLEATAHGLDSEIDHLVSKQRSADSLFGAVVAGRDLYDLYPDKDGQGGVSPKFYRLYQTQVCGRDAGALATASLIGRSAQDLQPNVLAIVRRGLYPGSSGRARLRRLIVDLVASGGIAKAQYYSLFPFGDAEDLLKAPAFGWDLLKYALHRAEAPPAALEPISSASRLMLLLESAAAILRDDLVTKRGEARFSRDVLDALQRGRITPAWLMARWVRAAENRGGFTFATFKALSGGSGRGCRELLFQLRLQWSGLEPLSEAPLDQAGAFVGNDTGLSKPLEEALIRSSSALVARKGLSAVRRFVSDADRWGGMSMAQFRAFLSSGQSSPAVITALDVAPHSDPDLPNIFRLRLALANILRILNPAPL